MRVAVAGLGWWGKEIIRSLGASRKFEVRVGIDPSPSEQAQAFLEAAGVEFATELAQVLARADIDGVILATPHSLHEEQVLAALAAGKEVFCEKPLAMSSAGARRMLDAAARNGRVLGMGHERRFEPAVAELMRMVRAGELGRLLHVETNVSHDLFRKLDTSNWRLDQKHAPAGMMTAVGIHITDIFIALAGPAESVRCVTDSMVFTPPAQDYVSASIRFRSGARGTITFMSATPFHGRIAVFGDQGWVELVSLGNVDQGLPTILTHCAATGAPRIQRSYEATDAVLANFEAWADAVTHGSAYPFTPVELLENIKLFEAVVVSGAKAGESVELEA
ncbi:Gfo/Idh/MocA family oxidoreductase [Verticiella sediminum]|uniref:Gfo/Idh/MocA family oxidoreductase n=1 Tax=Verticiella sediminum TaxID=1247510 RepID=A0A556AE97_9BURK|nr:Gfo/Idh/MocA family oxidoreductase [Verticiella sediminum]TSH91218.1 Gfo/Idh/MocA family oxidoreductase [Verticiella sediminum]